MESSPNLDERGEAPAPIVFVGGTGRTGTHIIAKLIGRHSAWSDITFEARFHCDPVGFPDLLAGRTSKRRFLRRLRGFWWRRYRSGGRPPDLLPWFALGRNSRGLNQVISREDFDAALDRFDDDFDADPEGACRRLFLDLLMPDPESGKGLVEMSCDNTAHAPMLAKLFPEAVFVHAVRDGRDASASRVRQGRGLLYPRTRMQGLEWWHRRLMRIEEALAEMPRERWTAVSLDMLVDKKRGKRALVRLLDFLGVEIEQRVRRFRRERLSRNEAHRGRWREGLSAPRRERIADRYAELLDDAKARTQRSPGVRMLRKVQQLDERLKPEGLDG